VHLRISRTDLMHVVSPKVGMTTGLCLPSVRFSIPCRNGMRPMPPISTNRLRVSGPMCEACRLPPETEASAPCRCAGTEREQAAVFLALMFLQTWKS
jgi:hypothetical protein